jgi:N6-adenosine-specific RNA methylase IME4
MNKHKFNNFPEMLPEEYARLKDDLDKNGYDVNYPIWFYEGQILDGWNRERACKELHIEPVYAEFTGSDMDAIEFVMRSNKRRNLTSSQWAAMAVLSTDIIEVISKEANERKLSTLKQNNTDVELIPQRRTSYQVAELFNTNGKYIQEAQRLKDEKPELFEAVKNGEKTITEVKREERNELQRDRLFEIKNLPEGVYDIIYCDPPWKYEFAVTDSRKIENQYPTMNLDDIRNLKLPELAKDSLLLMWATAPKLTEAISVIEAWGFNYRTHCIWDKGKIGMGYWFRGQHELLLLAVRGNFNVPLPENRIPSIYYEKRGEHSVKPIFFYEWIERSFGERKRIELFSRNKRDGWENWGNESV